MSDNRISDLDLSKAICFLACLDSLLEAHPELIAELQARSKLPRGVLEVHTPGLLDCMVNTSTVKVGRLHDIHDHIDTYYTSQHLHFDTRCSYSRLLYRTLTKP